MQHVYDFCMLNQNLSNFDGEIAQFEYLKSNILSLNIMIYFHIYCITAMRLFESIISIMLCLIAVRSLTLI